MKNFIKKIIYFLFPFLVIFIVLELFLTYSKNTFNSKAHFLKNNIDSIEVLVLGSSHHQDAVNPRYITLKTANLAYGFQDRQIDAALFLKYAPQLNNLKMVVLETDYTTFNSKTSADQFRLPWYYRYYGLETYHVSFLNKLSIYASSPAFFNNYLRNKFSPSSYEYQINEYGAVENDFPGIMMKHAYNSKALDEDYRKYTRKLKNSESNSNYEFNLERLKSIITYCKENSIAVVFSETPVYVKNEDFVNRHFYDQYKSILNVLIKHYQIPKLDYRGKTIFSIKDFKDFTHLNSNGAKKFSLFLNSELNALNKNILD